MAMMPTMALPGTEEKLAVLSARAAVSLPLFNRMDRLRQPATRMPFGFQPMVGESQDALDENYRRFWRVNDEDGGSE
jgi:hypothetical protein